MREIKFRAWHSVEKVMTPWHQMIDDHWDLSELNRRNIMQYTGLNDKNGKEIYQSDIIKTFQGTVFLVEWHDESARWAIFQSNKGSHPDLTGDWFKLEQYMTPNCEVIGNIYSNPELL